MTQHFRKSEYMMTLDAMVINAIQILPGQFKASRLFRIISLFDCLGHFLIANIHLAACPDWVSFTERYTRLSLLGITRLVLYRDRTGIGFTRVSHRKGHGVA